MAFEANSHNTVIFIHNSVIICQVNNDIKSNKERILTAASVLFLQGGASALSVRAIAKQAGVSTIGIYSHFEGKQGILDALYIEAFEMLSDAMDVLDEPLSPKEAALLAAHNYLELADSYEAHYRLIFGERDTHYEPSEEAQAVAFDAFDALIRLASNLLPAESTVERKQAVALQVWSSLHGVASLKHHIVGQIVNQTAWRDSVMQSIDYIIAGIGDEQP